MKSQISPNVTAINQDNQKHEEFMIGTQNAEISSELTKSFTKNNMLYTAMSLRPKKALTGVKSLRPRIWSKNQVQK